METDRGSAALSFVSAPFSRKFACELVFLGTEAGEFVHAFLE